ncbi:carbohydrate-binding domain-containing protein [Thalassiella azotivora]
MTDAVPTRGRTARRRVVRRTVVAAATTALLTTSAAAATATPHDGTTATSAVVTATQWQVDPAVGSVYRGWTGHDGTGLGLWRTGSATATTTVTDDATRVVLEAGADRCEGGATATLLVDGEPVLEDLVVDADRGRWSVAGQWAAGDHAVEVRYLDDHRTQACDRNLKVSRVWFDDAPTAASLTMRASSFARTPLDAGFLYGKGPQGEPTQLLWSNGSVSTRVTTPVLAAGTVTVDASAQECERPALLVVGVDGEDVGQVVPGPGRRGELRSYELALPGDLGAGIHEVTVRFVNDLLTGECDRNLRVGRVVLAGATG